METKTKTKDISILDMKSSIPRLKKISIAKAVLKQVTKCNLKQLFNLLIK